MYSKIKDIWAQRNMVLDLALCDFKTKYAGSYFGIIWAFVQPIMMISVFWFVFEVGFRAARVSQVPFILWLSCGLVPWFFFSDAWSSTTNVYFEYAYLVKKVLFRISILPLIKLTSAFFVHMVFVIFLLVMFMLYGYFPDIYTVQLIYYMFCMLVLVLAVSMITSSLMPFFRDIAQFLNIILQFGMWMTPIMWDYTMVDSSYHWLIKLNPVFYIVEGFRNTLIDKVWFWNEPGAFVSFWLLTLMLLLLGGYCFKRTKPYFSDVL